MRLTAVSFLIATALLLLATLQSCSLEQAKPDPRAGALAERSWTDGRATIVVEEVERGPELSPGTRQKWLFGPAGLKKPSPGNELLAIHTIFKRINGVHVTSLGPSTLFDTEGQKYEPWHSAVLGVQYLRDSFTSPSWVAAGAAAISIFEIPKSRIPARLTFVYHFKAGWDQVSEAKWSALTEETGRVEIDLK